MRFFIIIIVIAATTIPHLSTVVATTVGRCCRSAEILVLEGADLRCAPSTDKQLQQYLYASRRGQPKGLPRCGKLGHLLQILPEDALQVPLDACLELFRDAASGLTFPVIVHCSIPQPTSVQRFRFFASQMMLKSPPKILHLRKCCPVDEAYDPERKFCVQHEARDFRMLFDRLPELDYIDVYAHGRPKCPGGGVLVDFRVEELYDSRDAAEISIGVSETDGTSTNLTLNTDTLCLDNFGADLVARVCLGLDYCESSVCVRKCCDEREFVSREFARRECGAAAPTFENFSLAISNNVTNYGLLYGIPCSQVFGPDETWQLNDTGDITLSDYYSTDTYNYANACLDFMTDERGFTPMVCFPDAESFVNPPEKYKIGAGLQIISCFFLGVTFLVYCCLPSLQNLHGKTLMCHVASLFVAYASLAASQLSTKALDRYDNESLADTLCTFMAYSILLGFLSAFFWLNVMCFDIWWTFRGIREAKRHRQTSRFLAYCAYAWGLALLFVVLLLGLQLAGVLDNVIGRQRCWFEYHSVAEVAFFLLPVGLTLLVNLAFFVVTARRCSRVKAEINRAMANDKSAKNFHSDRSRLIMNVKLFVVMGIPWLFENVNSILMHYNTLPIWAREMFYVVDVINSLQGLWIFILFVLKSKVYEALRKRLRTRLKAKKCASKSSSNNTLSVNRATATSSRVRKSASSSTIVSCFITSTAN